MSNVTKQAVTRKRINVRNADGRIVFSGILTSGEIELIDMVEVNGLPPWGEEVQNMVTRGQFFGIELLYPEFWARCKAQAESDKAHIKKIDAYQPDPARIARDILEQAYASEIAEYIAKREADLLVQAEARKRREIAQAEAEQQKADAKNQALAEMTVWSGSGNLIGMLMNQLDLHHNQKLGNGWVVRVHGVKGGSNAGLYHFRYDFINSGRILYDVAHAVFIVGSKSSINNKTVTTYTVARMRDGKLEKIAQTDDTAPAWHKRVVGAVSKHLAEIEALKTTVTT